MLVFSTCWNSSRHQDGQSMLEEIARLGFNHVELSHGLKLSMLPGIMQAVDQKIVQVAGVHNYFPAPIDELGDTPDGKPFTSSDVNVRNHAIRLTKQSMEKGAKLGAKYIVLHMGMVEPLHRSDVNKQLRLALSEGRVGTRAYAEMKERLVRQRQKKVGVYFDRCKQAIDRLLPLAQELNMVLGIEGRSHFDQIPSESEAYELLSAYKDEPCVRYWHDFGHIQRKHHLLLTNHEQFIKRMSPWIGGAHVNDVVWPLKDHQVPFYGGSVDFDRLIPYFRGDLPFVWELSNRCEAKDIQSALEIWKARFPFTV